ncbi:MAG: polysaccharide deacetylase family protein, partial [Candidatus Aenigmatarchaeota archaeon]
MSNVAKKAFAVSYAILTACAPLKFQSESVKYTPKVESIQKVKFKYPVPVLLYHHFTIGKNKRYKLSVESFERQLKYLKEKGYTSLFLEELPLRCHEKSVVLTFDDVGRDFYELVFPILKKYEFKAEIFPIVCTIGKRGWLTWKQLKEMEESGLVDVQSHTMFHKDLTKLSDKELLYELSRSKEILEKNLGKEIKYLAWPYGKFNHRTIEVAKKVGYKGFLTVESDKNYELDFTRIKRIEVNGIRLTKEGLPKDIDLK